MGFDAERTELIATFTDGKKSSLKKLTNTEYNLFLKWLSERFNLTLKKDWQNSPANIMRRKIWVLFVQKMNYTDEAMQEWVVKYGKYHKPLSKHTTAELTILLAQAERVYETFAKAIRQ